VRADVDSWDAEVIPSAAAPVPLISRDAALRDAELRRQLHALPKYVASTRGRLLAATDDFDGVNPFQRGPGFACRAPYRFLYVNDFSFNISPCCYLTDVPGHDRVIYDGSYPFMEAWNSPAMVELRRRLAQGPLFNMCTKCPPTY
jgi:hypothetical protein